VKVGQKAVLDAARLDVLFEALSRRGYRIIGPTVRDGTIVCEELRGCADLPRGWMEEQDAGRYRLVSTGDGALFAHTLGPQAWKRFLHPPFLTLWRARREGTGFGIVSDEGEAPRFAFLGVRACDLHAIAVQDRVFLAGPHVDPSYRARRAAAFLVGVQCGRAGGTCFCASMETGPRLPAGFDLGLTEIIGPGRHDLVVEIGSEGGGAIAGELPLRPPAPADLEAAEAAAARAAAGMGRRLERAGVRELLLGCAEHPHWEEVAERCLACGNCTMVCPTCFCTTVEDVTDLTGSATSRNRRWDSCFTLEFSYLHGGSVRRSRAARYRQWITHKLATWHDQFGMSGCVGCGRCITWCPAGIDITVEVQALRQAPDRKEDGDVHVGV